MRAVAAALIAIAMSFIAVRAEAQWTSAQTQIGSETAVSNHLVEGREFLTPIEAILAYGKKLFNANWTDQEGRGAPNDQGNWAPNCRCEPAVSGKP